TKTQQKNECYFAFPDDPQNHEYYFTVDRVISSDISKYLDSPSSEKSPIFDRNSTIYTFTELIPPTDVKWNAPGVLAFRIASNDSMVYKCIIYKDGEECGFHEMGDYSGYIDDPNFIYYVAEDFDGTGTYTAKVFVRSNNWENSTKVYSENIPEIKWIQPDKRIAAPSNLRWEYDEDYEGIVAMCDPVENALEYCFCLYEDDEYRTSWMSYDNTCHMDYYIDYSNEHSYYFTISFITSSDLTKYANGYFDNDSLKSPIYKTNSNSTILNPEDTNDAILKKENDIFVCYVDGQRDDTYSGYANYENSMFFVENGSIKTDLNGVMIDPNSAPNYVWYFNANGQVQIQHVGLALYDGEWFYIENGKVASDMNAFVEYDGGLFAVGAGRIISEYSGLMQDPQDPINGDWYYFAAGQAQTQYTGLAMYDGVWFYVINGKLAVDYTGTVDYDGATFNVENGMVK
ncbi:MAG: hypothetical protein IKH46_14575, partial [Lachnospiraceae bacterium]|nr:hypothetical protein [Lachnospiraceae bacterium]